MKKFVKMSLVAAVALSAFSSNASARTLDEVAKNFDVFGYANVRYDDNTTDVVGGSNTSSYTHKVVLGATGKLTDDFSYMFAGTAFDVEDTNGNIEYDPLLMVYSYFTYTGIENTSITAGRQGLATPLTVVYDPATATSEADGVSVKTKLGAVNLEAAYFASTNFEYGDRSASFPGGMIDGGEEYVHVGLTSNVGPVALDAWYAEMDDKYNVYTVGAKAKFKAASADIMAYGRYTAADIDDVDADQSLWKVGVGAKMGIFGANLDYGQTDEEGGWVTFDSDASVNLKGWKIGLLGNADAELLKVGANVDLLPNLNLSANYVDMEIADNGQTEIVGQLSYKITKGVTAAIRFGQVDVDGEDDKRDFGRASILWLF